MSLKTGRREQKKLTNRRAILDAGLTVFSTIGYERATIMDVVEASGLSVGTLYNHFGDKDTIFAELVGNLVREVRAVLSESRSKAYDIESFILGAFHAYSALMEAQPKMQQLIQVNSNAFRRYITTDQELAGLIADLEQDMQAAVDSGIMPSFPVNLMTSAMMGASIEIFSEDISSHTAKQKAEFLGQIFLGGIQRLANV
ncbi:MAG: TetR/AcrR family transcriptional regulator [Oleiphilus sp.]